MKVLSIQAKRTKTDEKPYWRVVFEESHFPLILWDKPQFSEGASIPEDQLILSGDGQTYSLKTDSRTEQATEKDASIREQTAMKMICDLICAGKLAAVTNRPDIYTKHLEDWIDAALIHGPIISGLLEGKAHPVNKE